MIVDLLGSASGTPAIPGIKLLFSRDFITGSVSSMFYVIINNMELMKNMKYYLVIDLEATCWDRREYLNYVSEIIEIGAVLYNSEEDRVEEEFQTFVKPVQNPVLSEFCMELTSIKQKQVDNAPSFCEAMEMLKKKILDIYPAVFCSWGDYDREMFQNDCKYHKTEYPFKNHVNLKPLFSRYLGVKKKYGVERALKKLGLTFAGTPHRGIDDARNIVEILRVIKGCIT